MEYLDEFTKLDIEEIQGIGHLINGLKRQTVKTKWITAEVDRITALVYFIVVISVFIAASQLYPVFLQKFAQIFQSGESTKLAILIFSSLALIAVSIMFILRIDGLRGKASIVFRYLTALQTIKIDKEHYFKNILQEIERYLDNDDWTLTEYWVKHVDVALIETKQQKEYPNIIHMPLNLTSD